VHSCRRCARDSGCDAADEKLSAPEIYFGHHKGSFYPRLRILTLVSFLSRTMTLNFICGVVNRTITEELHLISPRPLGERRSLFVKLSRPAAPLFQSIIDLGERRSAHGFSFS
jgi:hypothetical protein